MQVERHHKEEIIVQKLLILAIVILVFVGIVYAQPITVTLRRFLDLIDTPSSYTGEAGKLVTVNSGETALEFATIADAVELDTQGDYFELDGNDDAMPVASPYATLSIHWQLDSNDDLQPRFLYFFDDANGDVGVN